MIRDPGCRTRSDTGSRCRDTYQHVFFPDVAFDHLIKAVGVYLASIFLFVTNNYLVGRYFETTCISCFSFFYPLILASIDDAPEQLLLCC